MSGRRAEPIAGPIEAPADTTVVALGRRPAHVRGRRDRHDVGSCLADTERYGRLDESWRAGPSMASDCEPDASGLTIAAVAHDAKKPLLVDWIARYREMLAGHRLVCTATTGAAIRRACPELVVACVKSGPLGGDQQIGAMIAEGQIDALIFFPDPLTPHPHDADVKALIRLALVYDIACAFNATSADILMQSGFFRRAACSVPVSVHKRV
jgi:methylglyoxal synthase